MPACVDYPWPSKYLHYLKAGAEVIKLFSCSSQLSMKLEMLINIKIARFNGISRFLGQSK